MTEVKCCCAYIALLESTRTRPLDNVQSCLQPLYNIVTIAENKMCIFETSARELSVLFGHSLEIYCDVFSRGQLYNVICGCKVFLQIVIPIVIPSNFRQEAQSLIVSQYRAIVADVIVYIIPPEHTTLHREGIMLDTN